jgi:toxin ParE1/3/4
MNLVWTLRAKIDRKDIREYIGGDDPAAAMKLDELFGAMAERLVAHPRLGRLGRLAGTRELVIHRSYILVYRPVGDTVQVLRLLHAGRKWPRGLDV